MCTRTNSADPIRDAERPLLIHSSVSLATPRGSSSFDEDCGISNAERIRGFNSPLTR